MTQITAPEPLPREGVLLYLNAIIVWGGLLFGISSLILALHGIISSKKKSRPVSLVALSWIVLISGFIFLSSLVLQIVLPPAQGRLSKAVPLTPTLQESYDNNRPRVTLTPERSDWTTYTSKSFGFSFQYPEEYQQQLNAFEWGIKMGCGCPLFDWFDIEVVNTSTGPQEWWTKSGKQVFNGEIGLNGKYHPEAYRVLAQAEELQGLQFFHLKARSRSPVYTTTPKPFQRTSAETFDIYVTNRANKMIVITLYEEVEKELFDQILSTFQFTSPLSSTEAIQIVSRLPEVRKFLEQVNGGGAVEAETDSSWTVHIYEKFPDHTSTFNWYEVNKMTGEVLAQF